MPIIRSMRATAVAVVATLSVAGCGGSDSPGGTSAEWRATMNDICKATNAKIDALGVPATAKGIAAFLEKGLPISTDEIAQITAVKGSADEAAIQAEVVAALEARNAEIRVALEKIRAGTPEEQAVKESDAKVRELAAKLDALAKDNDLSECGTS